MRSLFIKTQIHRLEDFKTFAEEFKLSENDLVLTHEFLFEPFMKELNTGSTYVFQEKYGPGEPSDSMIDSIISDFNPEGFQRIIAVGGGTVIDIAKILSLDPAVNSREIFEKKIKSVRKRELIVIPTTCGTGSEVTNISIAEIASLHSKLGLAADELYPDAAVLIPELLNKLPFKFFVYSSIDALIHAMESMVSPKTNCYTELFSKEAIRIILRSYGEILKNGEEYRTKMIGEILTASNFAGIAFANTGVGAVHALSYPLGGKYHVPHGEANYQFLSEVFNTYYRLDPKGKIRELAALIAAIIGCKTENEAFDRLEAFLSGLIKTRKLSGYGMKKEETGAFTENVLQNQQRLLVNSYVYLSKEEINTIYNKLY